MATAAGFLASGDVSTVIRPAPPPDADGDGARRAVARRHWKTGKARALGANAATLAVRHLSRRDKTGQLLSRKTVGRAEEMKEIKRRLNNLADGMDGGIILCQGDAGLGKSHICRQAIKYAAERDIRPLRGYCNALKDSTPYYPIQCMLEELFEVTFLKAEDAKRKVATTIEQKWPHLVDRIGLLNAVMPFYFEETMQVSVLKGFARMENTKRYLLELLQGAASQVDDGQMLLIFEDVHWMDSLSWSLLADVIASVHPIGIIITHRLWLEEFPPPIEYEELVASARSEIFDLPGLTRLQTAEMACRILRVDELPEVVLAAVVNRASGNPFFVSESVKYMLESKMIVLRGAESKKICLTGEEFGSSKMPPNGLTMCRARFELMEEPLRLILKVACVIGGTFTESMMKGVHPFPSQLNVLPKNLAKLQQKGYLSTDTYTRVLDDSWDHNAVLQETLYSFSHSVLEDMIYHIMPIAQQHELHRAAARYYEAAQTRMQMNAEASDEQQLRGDDQFRAKEIKAPPVAFSLALAHHWSHTSEPGMAAESLVAAGRDALRRFGNQEAVEHFTQAFDLVPEKGNQVSSIMTVSRAKLFLMAGEAFYSLGTTSLAAQYYRECLRLMDKPVVARLYMRLPIRALVRITAHKMSIKRAFCRSTKPLVTEDKDAAVCFEKLSHVHHNQLFFSLLLSLKQMEHLEPSGSSAALLRATSNVCYTASVLKLPKIAERHCKLAIKISGGVEDFTTLAYANRVCGLYSIGNGEWDRCFQMLQAAAEFSSQIHDWQGWYESNGYMAMANTLVGRYEDAYQQISTTLESVREAGHNDSLAWVLCGYIACVTPKGPLLPRDMEMLGVLEGCMQDGRDEETPLPLLLNVAGKGIAALARCRNRQYKKAEQLAAGHLFFIEKAGQADEEERQMADILKEQEGERRRQRAKQQSSAGGSATQRTEEQEEEVMDEEGEEEEEEHASKSQARAELRTMFTALPRCAVVEVYLELWNHSLSHEHHKMTHRALASLRELVNVFPVLRPRYHLYCGMANRLDGHTWAMMEEWRTSLDLAQQMQMAYEVGCAHYQLATWGVHTQAEEGLLSSELERRAHVAAAQQAFQALDPGVDEVTRRPVIEQTQVDAQAMRLLLNPPTHPIERGRNTTDVWPMLRSEPKSSVRYWRQFKMTLGFGRKEKEKQLSDAAGP